MCIFTYGWLKLALLFGIPESSWMDFMKIINVVFMNLGMWAVFDLIRRHRSKKTALCFLLFLICLLCTSLAAGAQRSRQEFEMHLMQVDIRYKELKKDE